MPKFRKKPVVVEVLHYDGSIESFMRIYEWARGFLPASHAPITCEDEDYPGRLYIDTREGTMRANPGDYIIRGVMGEYYARKPDIFEATYEPAEEGQANGE